MCGRGNTKMSRHLLAVNEIFGPTFQGEGPTLGTPCIFLRLAGCNLACTWCDTPYTWDWSRYDKSQEVHMMPVSSVVSRLLAISGEQIKHLVISGGEPLLQGARLIPLVNRLRDAGWEIEVETAGTIAPPAELHVHRYNISPKLENSGNQENRRYHPAVLEVFNRCVLRCFKFVVQHVSDFSEIDRIVVAHNLSPVYIMPEGVDADLLQSRLPQLAEAAVLRNYHVTTRLHTLTYGNLRAI